MDVQVNEHDPTKYTDEELLKHCADSHNLLTRKAGERWAQAKKDNDLLVGQNIEVCAYNERLLNERNAVRADLAAAREELDEEREAWDLANGTANLAIQHRNAAEADLAAARVDAARYRFLRGDGPPESSSWPRWRIEQWCGYWNLMRGADMDAAIDAALAEGEANDQA